MRATPPCPALPPALAARAFGGAHTSAERRLRWDEDAVSPGFIRLSAGIENAQDLVADVCAAPDATAGAA